MHQDAHEFLNYLLNSIAEDVEKYQKGKKGVEKQTQHDQGRHVSRQRVHMLKQGR